MRRELWNQANSRSIFQRRRAPAERAAVLRAIRRLRPMFRDQFDAVGRAEVRIQPVAVIAAVADQARRERVEEGASSVAATRVTSCGEALAT